MLKSFALLLSCASAGWGVFTPADSDAVLSGYDLHHPAATYVMPEQLREISGHAWLSRQRIGCIEDQTGNIYLYNLATKTLEKTLHFGKKGDYEDVARLNGFWLVLRSDGTLFKYTDQGVTTTYATGLTEANNTEGLAYDAASNTLLVACKAAAGVGEPDAKRAIYRLDPVTYRAGVKPTYVLDVAQLIALDHTQGKGATIDKFAPSAVAVQPLTHHIFVLAASGNALVELDVTGKALTVQKLPRKLFPQPEGLAFAPNGDLYISSEGGDSGGPGLVQVFRAPTTASTK